MSARRVSSWTGRLDDMGLKEGYAALDLEEEWGVFGGVNLVQTIMSSISDLVLLMCSWNI